MDANTSNDLFEQQVQPRGSLNTLTTLTYIGCALGYISSIYSFFKASNYESEIAKLQDMGDRSGSPLSSKMIEESIQMIQKGHEYRYIILVSGLLFTTLCLTGAMQMRQLKKSGFPLYLVGELAPFIISIALIGFSLLGSIAIGFSALIALIFVILYSTQRKYLVY